VPEDEIRKVLQKNEDGGQEETKEQRIASGQPFSINAIIYGSFDFLNTGTNLSVLV
jgi:hypothetical protein